MPHSQLSLSAPTGKIPSSIDLVSFLEALSKIDALEAQSLKEQYPELLAWVHANQEDETSVPRTLRQDAKELFIRIVDSIDQNGPSEKTFILDPQSQSYNFS